MTKRTTKLLLVFIIYTFNSLSCYATEISISVLTVENKPVVDAVVYVKSGEASKNLPMAVMNQHDKTFVPHVLAVPVGTTVDFPNSDSVNHYVYSFSDIKKFQLKLFKGDLEKHQMLFDKPGIVTIGCNIHDFMFGYIFVAPTAYVGVTNSLGEVKLSLPEKGDFSLGLWHERANEDLEKFTQKITVNSAEQKLHINFTKSLKPPRKMTHEGDSY